MHGAGGQHHAIAGLQLELTILLFEHERDRTIDAVQHLLVRMAVGRIAIMRTVGPRVAAMRLTAELCHQGIHAVGWRGSGHPPDSKIAFE